MCFKISDYITPSTLKTCFKILVLNIYFSLFGKTHFTRLNLKTKFLNKIHFDFLNSVIILINYIKYSLPT